MKCVKSDPTDWITPSQTANPLCHHLLPSPTAGRISRSPLYTRDYPALTGREGGSSNRGGSGIWSRAAGDLAAGVGKVRHQVAAWGQVPKALTPATTAKVGRINKLGGGWRWGGGVSFSSFSCFVWQQVGKVCYKEGRAWKHLPQHRLEGFNLCACERACIVLCCMCVSMYLCCITLCCVCMRACVCVCAHVLRWWRRGRLHFIFPIENNLRGNIKLLSLG